MHKTRYAATRSDFSTDPTSSDSRSVKIVPFQVKHLDDIVRRDTTGDKMRLLESGVYAHMFDYHDLAFSAVNERGEAVAAAGVVPYWKGRCEAWALLANNTPQEFLVIHRAVKRFLRGFEGRLESIVSADFVQGHRWMKLLGFKIESLRMEKYFPNGDDAYMYALVR